MTFFKKAIEDMAADSLRCVAIAYRSYEKEKVPTNEELLSHWSLPEDDLILLAIVGLKVCISLETCLSLSSLFFCVYMILCPHCFSLLFKVKAAKHYYL